jgi:hypothetical protein
MFGCERVDLAITPDQLFEVLADAESWPRWASVITKVTWTSPEPRGVGTTRTVEMRGGIVGNVGAPPACGGEFIAWGAVAPHGIPVNECSAQAVAAFAEDYRVEDIPGGCRLTWTMAHQPAGFAATPTPGSRQPDNVRSAR